MGRSVDDKYARAGHPSIEELVAEQGTKFRADPAELWGDFWPESESIEDFLKALHEWRGHNRSDRQPLPHGRGSDARSEPRP